MTMISTDENTEKSGLFLETLRDIVRVTRLV